MIQSKDDLKYFLATEADIYYAGNKWKHILAHTKNHAIYRFLSALRHEEYYKNVRHDAIGKAMYLFNKRRKNKMGQKLGFDIPANCVDVGFLVSHVGGVIINGDSRVGKNFHAAGDICIGAGNGGSPVIGDDCTVGFGAMIIGGIEIADRCSIAAGAVVTRGCSQENVLLIGVPARVRNKSCEQEEFIQ